MTLAEIERATESYSRKKKYEAKEKATYDYILAQLITNGVGAAIAGGKGMPTLYEAYAHIFEEEIIKDEKQKQDLIDTLSALRFRQYADFHNSKIKKEVAITNE